VKFFPTQVDDIIMNLGGKYFLVGERMYKEKYSLGAPWDLVSPSGSSPFGPTEWDRWRKSYDHRLIRCDTVKLFCGGTDVRNP
jgi:hypothetical protein